MKGRKRHYPPLTPQQQSLIEDYLSDSYKRVKQCISLTLHRPVTSEEFEEYIGIADMALVKAASSFNPHKRMSFTSFANLNISSAIKTELTRQNRQCRIGDKTAKSLDDTVDEDENIRIIDTLSSDGEITVRETQNIKRYLSTLSADAKTVLRLRLYGYDVFAIRKRTGFTPKQIQNALSALQKYERVSILRNN